MRLKKRRKSSRMHGRGAGSHGWGFRKKHKKSGHRGGKGMAGSGKRADQKKSLILKLYGNEYFGKQGITSRKTKRDTRKRISLLDIDSNIDSYIKNGSAKKGKDGIEVSLENYKILGSFKNYVPKNKLIITAKEASKTAIETVRKAGGKIIILKKSKSAEEGRVSKDNSDE
ncbi:MAG: uL15 family ribosomal protein [Candidatus Pacearchaeota archaeon]